MSKKNNIKKILILICMCIILFLTYEIIHIYAIFHSEVVGNVKFKNGVWNIVVNGTEITKGIDVDFVIDNVVVQEDTHVKQGKIAPGLSGNFQIQIEPKNTNVSIKYDIILHKEILENNNLKITSVQEVLAESNLIQTAENTYTSVIPLSEIKNGIVHKIQVDIQWLDDGTQDEEDTKLGSVFDSKIQIPVTVHACQYLGEDIIPYVKET